MDTSIIAITGPSGSGKTWLASALQDRLSALSPAISTAVVPEDAYYRDQSHLKFSQRLSVNYDHPDALEHDLMLRQLATLRANQPVELPVYDYINHTRAQRVRPIQPAPLLIVEGVLLLSQPALRKQFDLALYLDTPIEKCMDRRMQRDVRERGRSQESVREQFEQSVLPMYHKYVAPSREHADLMVNTAVFASPDVDALAQQILDNLAS